jgi:uncharacterized protein (DUF362 family)
MSPPDPEVSRRDFLRRAGLAGATIAVGGGLAWSLLDRPGHAPMQLAADSPVFPDWSTRDDGPSMAIVNGSDRKAMLDRLLAAMGGIERFVRPGDKVLVKPNIGFATPVHVGATSHPDVVAEVVRRCLAVGAASVVVTDFPVNDPESTFRITGIEEAARGAGAQVILPRDTQFRTVSVPGSSLLVEWPIMTVPFTGIDKVIGICPVKDHGGSGVTLSIKNWWGVVGGRRNLFHQRMHEFIAELAMLVKPSLVILDGTESMISNGPTGGSTRDLSPTQTMIASTDPVAADAFGATLLGRSIHDLPFLAKAASNGAGTVDWESLRPIRVSLG